MITLASSSAGRSISLPTGPVIFTLAPASMSHRKVLQTPLMVSPSLSYWSWRTHSDTVLPAMLSPWRVLAIEYRRSL